MADADGQLRADYHDAHFTPSRRRRYHAIANYYIGPEADAAFFTVATAA